MAPQTILSFDYSHAYAHKEYTSPVFLRHQGVSGQVVVSNVLENNIDKVKIVLKGTLRNCIAHACSAYYQPHRLIVEQNILKLTDVQDSLSTLRPIDGSTDEEQFYFNFQLRSDRRASNSHGSHTNKLNGTLPSSVNVHGPWCVSPTGQPSCFFDGRVRYEVQAFAYCADEVIASAVQEIRIYDTPEPFPPPIHMAHFPGEYVCSQEKRLKRFMNLRGSQRLSISVSEPKPLDIPGGSKSALAAFQMRFVLRSESGSRASSPPGAMDVRINSALKMTTYVAVGSMDSQPTIKNTQTSPLLASNSRNCRVYHRKLHVTGWKLESGAWVKEMTVWIPLVEGSYPTPTFFTSYLARRYSVAMRIEANASEGSASYYLNIPIQLVYSDAPVYSERSSLEECEFSIAAPNRLPIYSR